LRRLAAAATPRLGAARVQIRPGTFQEHLDGTLPSRPTIESEESVMTNSLIRSGDRGVRKDFITVVVAFAAAAFTASSAMAEPSATVAFELTGCQLTITSTKDISNFSLNGVKTEGFANGTTTLVISVAEGDVVDVKSGVTTAAFTMTGCLNDNGDGFD
jgi:hypothetical protein